MYHPEFFLRRMDIVDEHVRDWEAHPFNLPAVRQMAEIDFRQPVTILAGENGSGKSTLIEGLAELAGMSMNGGSKQMRSKEDEENKGGIAWCCRLARGVVREVDGYFLRAENYINVSHQLLEYEATQPGLLARYYGGNPFEKSHGEAFFSLVVNRFGGDSLFILDEPESALSPTRQLSLMIEMKRLVDSNCQFVVATHSPILMAFPGAKLYWLSKEEGIEERDYQQTDHYAVMKRMLTDPEGYLRMIGLIDDGSLGL